MATIVSVPLDWSLHPERAALLVRHDEWPFVLIGRGAGGGALIGSEPVRVAAPDENPFALLEEQPAIAGAAGTGVVGGGWFGYLGYGLSRRLERLDASPPASAAGLPDFALAFYDHLLRFDGDGRWWFEALWTDARAPALRARLRSLKARAAAGAAERPRPFATDTWRVTPGRTGHALAVSACRDRIHVGDLFQANVCVRLASRLAGSPLDLFATAAGELRPDRAAFLAGPWGAVASLSPELFLERQGRRVRSAPIKGTRPRPADEHEALAQRAALASSPKDRAENVMIVDLVRNDLGRVCAPGSIHVDALHRVRAHTGVWHLVSEVSGTLRDGTGDGELVRAAFPPGSVSGAPKVAAMNVIAELESIPRSVYTGAIGFASPVAGLELSVAIRTFEVHGEHIWLGVGGGIVADSDPLGEAAECATKARPLLASIGARVADWGVGNAGGAPAGSGVGDTGGAPRPRRLGPRPHPRPDPRAGVFETLLDAGGRPLAVGAHLARLAHSVAELYGRSLCSGLREEILEAAGACHVDRARLRVDVHPRARGLHTGIEVTALAPRRVPVALRPAAVPGGLGAHKWTDRRLLDALADGDGEPRLCDLDGLVLESARASVFAVEAGPILITPPDDGRILPGVTRARVLALAREHGLPVRAESIDLTRLHNARELFVTGALGGVEPARLHGAGASPNGECDGEGTLTAQLAGALRRAEQGALAPA
jgi:para-aminobenzoate synthetase/4-amino-4-deoxychorismate lyase